MELSGGQTGGRNTCIVCPRPLVQSGANNYVVSPRSNGICFGVEYEGSRPDWGLVSLSFNSRLPTGRLGQTISALGHFLPVLLNETWVPSASNNFPVMDYLVFSGFYLV